MPKKRVIIYSCRLRPDGVPASERKKAFSDYFERQGFTVTRELYPETVMGKLKALVSAVVNRNILFLSMPPFRYWLFIFFPFTRTVIDIRDGWSIAIESGYGGSAKARPLRARVARFVEKYAIKKSFLTITCTTGLQQHLDSISKNEVLLIPNSFSEGDLVLAHKALEQEKSFRNSHDHKLVRGICVGKFSEYGEENVKNFLTCVSHHYCNSIYELTIVGADNSANSWIHEWIAKSDMHNLQVKILGRLPKEDLYKLIAKHDHGVTIIRDPSYEFGTKVFDYIACGKPIFNYFEEHNNFTRYFDGYLTHNNPGITKMKLQSREDLVSRLDCFLMSLR